LSAADQRFYASSYGRFNTPDPFGGSAKPRDPLSWNRYSYTRGDPVNRHDPSGLDDGSDGESYGGVTAIECQIYDINNECQTLEAMFGGDDGSAVGGPLPTTGGNAPAVPTPGVFANDLGSVNSNNFLTYSSAYDLVNGAPGFGGSTASTAAVNGAYQLACQYATNPCTAAGLVSVQNRGGTVNIVLIDNPLDPNSVDDCWSDPLTGIFHSGAPSYYCGGNYLGNTGHVVNDPFGTGAHYDDPGPLNPLHWLTSIFAWASDPAQQYVCSLPRGCAPQP